jgi:D-ribose pyranase
MKKSGILNPEICKVVAQMGHFDLLAICDAGMPIAECVTRIDVSVKQNIPSFIDVLDAVLNDLEIQKVFIAKEMESRNQKQYSRVKERFRHTEIKEICHEEIKTMLSSVRAVIRTGEFTPYSNIILESSVVF